MIEGSRGKTSPPAWAATIASTVSNADARAACVRAGFILIRDVAPFTAQELIRDHGFTEFEADILLREFQEDDQSEGLCYGKDFYDLAWMYIRDAEGDGEGNPDRAKLALSEMFDRSISNKAEVAKLKRSIREKRSTGREDRWRRILASPAEE